MPIVWPMWRPCLNRCALRSWTPVELPAELPAVPRVEEEPDRSRPAVEPPVPSVLDVLVPLLPVPAALPPVPREVLLVPPPALLPPVPSVLAEPLPVPAPAALPPVPSVVLVEPPPAELPPVPSVELDWA